MRLNALETELHSLLGLDGVHRSDVIAGDVSSSTCSKGARLPPVSFTEGKQAECGWKMLLGREGSSELLHASVQRDYSHCLSAHKYHLNAERTAEFWKSTRLNLNKTVQTFTDNLILNKKKNNIWTTATADEIRLLIAFPSCFLGFLVLVSCSWGRAFGSEPEPRMWCLQNISPHTSISRYHGKRLHWAPCSQPFKKINDLIVVVRSSSQK